MITAPYARPRRHARRGLTLIEVLIVIAILLAIGGLVVVNLLPKQEQADVDLMKVQLGNFDQAMKLFKLDMKRFPSEDEGLAALWSRDAIEDEEEADTWKGPYMEIPQPRDAWGSEWIYQYPGQLVSESFYDVISLGPDKEEGTEDDIHNHLNKMGADGELNEDFEDFSMPEDGLE